MPATSLLNRCTAIGLLTAATLGATPSQAQVDLRTLSPGQAGSRAQVVVLGTVHLGEMAKDFKPGSLDTLRARLAQFKPDIITIEAESGEECDLALRHPTKYGADYCELPAQAQAATGMDLPTALAEVAKTLKTWPQAPTPAQRRRLAALFLAAKEPASAFAQWLQLPPTERHPGDLLDAPLVNRLNGYEARPDESLQIAARLAAQLGLARVHPTDNHTGDQIQVDDTQAFVKDLEAAWKASGTELEASLKLEAPMKQADDLLPLYRWINRPEHLGMLARMNIQGPMASQSAQRYPQMWVGGWEVRNLRMVANIAETFRERPGVRVLTVVGASHKPWFDQWLGQLQGVTVLDTLQILGSP